MHFDRTAAPVTGLSAHDGQPQPAPHPSPAWAVCSYCERQISLTGLEPCCDRPEHAGCLVCADIRGCLDVVLRCLHDQEQRQVTATPADRVPRAPVACLYADSDGQATDAAPAEPSTLAAVRAVLAEVDGLDLDDGQAQAALQRIDQIATGSRVATGLEADGGAYLTPGDVATAIAALGDAADWHEYRASLTCADCTEHPAELCDVHGAALDAAAAYRALIRALGGEDR